MAENLDMEGRNEFLLSFMFSRVQTSRIKEVKTHFLQP